MISQFNATYLKPSNSLIYSLRSLLQNSSLYTFEIVTLSFPMALPIVLWTQFGC